MPAPDPSGALPACWAAVAPVMARGRAWAKRRARPEGGETDAPKRALATFGNLLGEQIRCRNGIAGDVSWA
jgi:hypothetical protein